MRHQTLALLIVVGLNAVRPQGVHAQTCDGRTEFRLDQENYLAVTDRVYVYAPDINSLGKTGGWQPFNVNVLVGTYRKPFLLPKALLKENDLKGLLARRQDITASVLTVAGSGQASSGKAPQASPVSVKDGERPVTITIRVTRVVPVSGGTDHLFLTCT